MDLLYYNELNYSTVKTQFHKIEKFLKEDNFQSASIKKIPTTDYYRAKLDSKNRLLFKFAKYKEKKYILLLEVILNHDYEKSKFLSGTEVDENKFNLITKDEIIPKKDFQDLIYLNKNRKDFYFLDKIIFFDDFQNEIYYLQTPLIIIGSAGSGKTILTLEKLKKLRGNIAYISLSQYLIENAQSIYFSNNYENPNQEIDFLSFEEYVSGIKIPKGSELIFMDFEKWFARHKHKTKISEPYRLFEEFKGVLTGSVTEEKFLSRKNYLKLGVKKSIFTKKQREEVYDIFEKYLKFLENSHWYDLNMISFEYLNNVEKKYDFIVIDEVQDITVIQLKLILNSLKEDNKFILSGDSNQIVHPNFFSWSNIKTLFYKGNFDFSLIRILKTNYRNSQKVTELSNNLLKIKNARFGSIDKESTFLINSVSKKQGDIFLIKDDKKKKRHLNSKTQNSTKFAVLVMNNQDKKFAKMFFKTPLVFSVQEAKGLEYENIILFNFVSNSEKEFNEITRELDDKILHDEIKYSRAKNKEDKDLEVYKFFINSLYVAFTRSIKNLYIIESKHNHRIFELLKLKESKQNIKIKTQQSDSIEWLTEASKLEKQGKFEQAQEIRDKIAGLKYINNEEYENLKKIALDENRTEKEVKRERKDLFRYAIARKIFDDIEKLAHLNFLRAIQFMKNLKLNQKILSKNCRLDRTEGISRIIKDFGVNLKSDNHEMTGIMLAIFYNSKNIFDIFMKNDPDINLKNLENLNPLQMLLRNSFYNVNYDIDKKNEMKNFLKFYGELKNKNLKCKLGDKLIIINNYSMEYFLLNFFIGVGYMIIKQKEETIIKEMKEETFLYQKKQLNKLKKIYPIKKLEKMNFLDNFREEDKLKFAEKYMKKIKEIGISLDDFIDFFEKMPTIILAKYRKKRSYISSILSNNEIDRVFIYNKKLFRRVKRGHYILNPELKII